MITRRTVAALAIALSAALAVPALASTKFTQNALVEAQKAGKSVLVEVTAPWCPICRAQKVALGDLAKQERFKRLVTFEVDFDSQKDALKALNARMQGTLIVYKGDKEMGRLVGDTKKESIEALLAKAL
jgi:thiol:disulfide interchange protein